VLLLLGRDGLWYNDISLRKFQNLNHPKNHEYDGEINETWDNYCSGTAKTQR